ncbi:protease [Pullulanibacillus camelliae]|uniref:Protease n=1 Tax=Pullulanibacillus camelliae TaxID=1707096 RepID=A0A8J2YKC7_9BACL|nr:immune inhibitor A domain-containing protein [Pullulanibacillus camelliae]GGE50778.1 protease [Pullulanibacillus camelliae]
MRDWRKKFTVPLVSASLLFAMGTSAAFAKDNGATSDSFSTSEGTAPYLAQLESGGPFDVGMVNDDLLLKALIKQGVVKKSASTESQKKALTNYVKKRAAAAAKLGQSSPTAAKKARQKLQKQAGIKVKPGHFKDKNKFNHKPHGPGHYNGKVSSIKTEKWTGAVRKDKLLVLLIDFPDYASNDLPKKDGNDGGIVLNLPDYPKEHYQDMIFGDKGYDGPNGQNLISVKQFYEQQSGGSYTIDGDVYGWYHAKHPASYYGGHDDAAGNDKDPRALVNEALEQAAADGVELSQYDQEDQWDLDGDGNLREPDGIIDHLVVVHSGIGEESGGGSLGGDAIWSHSWDLGGAVPISGSHTNVPYWDGQMAGYKYTIQPEDGAAGVFAHEFGHNLGLPDEYDIDYSTPYDEPVGYWSIMSAGSWGGKIAGTEPTGFSAYDKEFLQNEMPDLNWFKNVTVDTDDLRRKGTSVKLDEASVKGTNADAVRVNLPDKKTVVNSPFSGQKEFFSGQGNNLDHAMTATVDLSQVKSSAALSFKTWYDIEQDWDYASVQVKKGDDWVSVPGNITTSANPNGQNPGNGITGSSNGWKDAQFDLSDFIGKKITLKFNYWSDGYVAHPGFYADNITITGDGQTLLSDNADTDSSAFTLDGFTKDEGFNTTENYYLLEWRNWDAADKALAHISRGHSLMTYDPGLVVWYVDNKYDNNVQADHPGNGFLSVVDAHQKIAKWSDGTVAADRYQVQDAAFSKNKTDAMFLNYMDLNGTYLKERAQRPVSVFFDKHDYSETGPILDNGLQTYLGVKLPKNGVKINVIGQSRDMTVGAIHISK